MTHEEKLTSPRSRAILALLEDHGYDAHIDPDPDTNRVIIVTGTIVTPSGGIYTTYGWLPRDYIQVRLFVEGKLETTPYEP